MEYEQSAKRTSKDKPKIFMIQDCRDNEGLAKEQPQQYYSNFNIEFKSEKIISPKFEIKS